MGLRRYAVALLTLVVVTGLVLGVVSGLFARAAQAGLYATGLWSAGGASTVAPTLFDTPVPASSSAEPTSSPTQSAAAAELPRAVLAPADTAVVPQPANVRARVAAVNSGNVQGRISAAVVEVGSGKVLYRQGASTPKIPASTNKLLSSAAVLSLLGPEHRFTTRVVQPSKGRIILVGGGDPYLAKKSSPQRYPERASVEALAKSTALALKKQHRRTVRLGYDASLFTGPAWNPLWPTSYGDQVTRVSALWVDGGRLAGGSPGPRATDPARAAAATFAASLRRQGIKVSAVENHAAPKSAKSIAAVPSMPLERIVEQVLLTSDNDAAEVLFRQAAVASGRGGSNAAARKAVQAELAKLGAWQPGTAVYDGSGLAREDQISAQTLVRLLRLGADEKHPKLRGLVTGLAVAGVEGSLRSRFFDDQTLAARGVVRGKTGTLRRVHSLAGLVRARDGSLLVYAFLVNDPKNDYAARIWLDRVTAAIAACGCR